MRYGDCWAGSLVAVIGAISVAAAWPLERWSDFGPGPGFFPLLLGTGLILTGTVVGITGWLGRKSARPSNGSFRKPLLVAGVMAGYLVLLEIVGFALATGLFLFALLYWIESRSAWQALLLAIFVTLGVHLVFVTFLKTSLPPGIFNWIS